MIGFLWGWVLDPGLCACWANAQPRCVPAPLLLFTQDKSNEEKSDTNTKSKNIKIPAHLRGHRSGNGETQPLGHTFSTLPASPGHTSMLPDSTRAHLLHAACLAEPRVVAHACKFQRLGDRGGRIRSSRPALATLLIQGRLGLQETLFQKPQDWAGDKVLTMQPQDQSSDLQNTHESWAGMAALCSHSAWEAERRDPCNKLARLMSWNW